MCSADEQPSVEEEQECICQAAVESTEAGPPGEALQCWPSSRALADVASQLDLCLQSASNNLNQEYSQVSYQLSFIIAESYVNPHTLPTHAAASVASVAAAAADRRLGL